MTATKEHILRTALILFLQKSYRDVTMSEIVEKTGLSKGAFYHYFKGKEELFREIVNLFLSMGSVNYEHFSKESLELFFHQYIEHLDASMQQLASLVSESGSGSLNFNFFFIMFEAASRFPDFLEQELQIYKKDLEVWKERIAEARKKGEIRSVSGDEELARLFLFCNDGVFIRFLNDEKKGQFRDYLEETYQTIYNNIKS
ncbi:MAG: TetR/AcrR family transcriptional regulator [Bacteroidota bacterium]